MQCQCSAFYVGKTRKELGKRVEKHMHSMHKGNLQLPLGRHIARQATYTYKRERLEKGSAPAQNATTPPGLNEFESLRPFLDGFSSGKTD